jgi:antitoxin (DNA-binding transcriptional repressor) of toxin-antitoxin stability system
MTAAHDFELPPHTGAPAEAVEAAEHGQVVYLTRNGHTVAAIVPPEAIEALEDADDIRAARAALDEPGPDIPMSEVWAEYADILGPYPPKSDSAIQ